MTFAISNRRAAIAAYKHNRKQWSREAAFYMTIVRFGDSPIQRLACALTPGWAAAASETTICASS